MGDRGLVWHYTDAQGLLSILGGHTLWATAAGFLNDAGEVELGSTLLRRELEERAAGDPFYATLLDLTAAKMSTDGPSHGEFFVLSAAHDWDLLAVWRNYGGRGESYAIGLDPTAPLAVLAGAEVPLPGDDLAGGALVRHLQWSPVRYLDTEQRLLVDAVFDNLKDELSWVKEAVRAGTPLRELLLGLSELLEDMEQALLLIKHAGFADEREIRHSTVLYRGLVPDQGDVPATWPPGLVNYRATAYGLAPYLKLTGAPEGQAVVTRAAPLPIRALGISPSANSSATARTLLDLLVAHGYPAVPVHRSTIPFRE